MGIGRNLAFGGAVLLGPTLGACGGEPVRPADTTTTVIEAPTTTVDAGPAEQFDTITCDILGRLMVGLSTPNSPEVEFTRISDDLYVEGSYSTTPELAAARGTIQGVADGAMHNANAGTRKNFTFFYDIIKDQRNLRCDTPTPPQHK